MRRSLLFGMGLGAALMYLLDPSWGRRRRAQLRAHLESGAQQVETWRNRSGVRRAAMQDDSGDAPRHEDETDIDWTTGDSYRARLMGEDQG
jgi:hypothetical protein